MYTMVCSTSHLGVSVPRLFNRLALDKSQGLLVLNSQAKITNMINKSKEKLLTWQEPLVDRNNEQVKKIIIHRHERAVTAVGRTRHQAHGHPPCQHLPLRISTVKCSAFVLFKTPFFPGFFRHLYPIGVNRTESKNKSVQ